MISICGNSLRRSVLSSSSSFLAKDVLSSGSGAGLLDRTSGNHWTSAFLNVFDRAAGFAFLSSKEVTRKRPLPVGCCGLFDAQALQFEPYEMGYWGVSRIRASSSPAGQVPISMPRSKEAACLFCKISSNEGDPHTQLVYEDDQFVAFRDIRPATTHHFLIVPKRHVESARHLVADDAELVERLVVIGREVLARQGVLITDTETDQCRMGFHWPPFNGIKHLHLHVLYPVSNMSFWSRTIFRPDSWWFVTPSTVVRRLEKKSRDEL